jgi:hypothetical protein
MCLGGAPAVKEVSHSRPGPTQSDDSLWVQAIMIITFTPATGHNGWVSNRPNHGG